jgi:hypothetical protein
MTTTKRAALTDFEVFARIADLLDITDRADYGSVDDLADELRDEVADLVTDAQSYAIAEQVEAWWASCD